MAISFVAWVTFALTMAYIGIKTLIGMFKMGNPTDDELKLINKYQQGGENNDNSIR